MDRKVRPPINHASKAIYEQIVFHDKQVNETLSNWYPFTNPCFVCIAPPA